MSKKYYLWIIGLVIFLLILTKIGLSNIVFVLSKMRISYAILACILTPSLAFLKASRWRYLLKMQGINYSFKASFLTYLAGLYLGLVTPGRIGELVKVYYLKQDKRISVGKSLSSILVDRFLDILVLVIFGCLGLFIFSVPQRTTLTIVALTGLFSFGWIVVLNRKYGQRILRFLYKVFLLEKIAHRAHNPFNDFYLGVEKMRNWRLAFPLLVSLFAFFIGFFQCYLLSVSLNIPIPFLYLIFSVAIANLVSLIPISIAGIGTRDATLIGLFAILGIKPESAVSFSLMYLFVFNISLALMGLPAWWKQSAAYALKKQNEREPDG